MRSTAKQKGKNGGDRETNDSIWSIFWNDTFHISFYLAPIKFTECVTQIYYKWCAIIARCEMTTSLKYISKWISS